MRPKDNLVRTLSDGSSCGGTSFSTRVICWNERPD